MRKNLICLTIFLSFFYYKNAAKACLADSTLLVKKTTDFMVNGEGSAANWKKATWFDITVQKGPGQPKTGPEFPTRAKVMYSGKGMYFLFDSADKKLTSTIMEDFGLLFKEDVVEVFLWPDTSVPWSGIFSI